MSPARLHLEGHTLCSLRYLQGGDRRQNAAEDAARFQAWKSCLGVLGIPFLDVVRVLAAVLLLGNITFADGAGIEVGAAGVQPVEPYRTMWAWVRVDARSDGAALSVQLPTAPSLYTYDLQRCLL